MLDFNKDMKMFEIWYIEYVKYFLSYCEWNLKYSCIKRLFVYIIFIFMYIFIIRGIDREYIFKYLWWFFRIKLGKIIFYGLLLSLIFFFWFYFV